MSVEIDDKGRRVAVFTHDNGNIRVPLDGDLPSLKHATISPPSLQEGTAEIPNLEGSGVIRVHVPNTSSAPR